jgi:hypothetical protein
MSDDPRSISRSTRLTCALVALVVVAAAGVIAAALYFMLRNVGWT